MWSSFRNSILLNSLSITSEDELSSSSSDSGLGDFAVGTKCVYFVKKSTSSSLSVSSLGDVFASHESSVVGLLSVFL